jgi:ABC-2 type transport system permease protein
MINAILRAQLLSMRLRVGTRRRGTIFSVLTGLVFYGVWTFLAFGAMLYFADPNDAPFFLPVLSTGLLFVMLYWQLAPVISAGFGASLDLSKLLVYPIPRRKLFTVEVLLRLTNCAEMLILLAGAAVGLMRNPLYGPWARLLVILGALLFAATNLLLSAGVRHWLERLFQRTRMKEVLMLLLVALAVLPQILLVLNVRRATLLRLAPAQLFWPWGVMARLMLSDRIALAAPLALLYLGIALWFGRWQFERSIRFDATREGTRESTRGVTRDATREDTGSSRGRATDRLFRFPSRFLPDPLGALIEKELRTFARIPRFRMVYGMSCVLGIVLYLPALRGPRTGASFFAQNALPLMALYGLMMMGPITYWNSFGFDRSAVQGYFSWPIRFRDVLFAKNITVALLLLPQIVMISVVGLAARLPVSPGKCVETLAVMVIASLYWFSLGNITSVKMPRPMDPGRMNQMANKMQALSIWTAPLLLLPIGLAYWAREVFESEIVFCGVLLIAAIVGGVFYKVGLDSALSAAASGRESMLMQLSRSDGPLSVT